MLLIVVTERILRRSLKKFHQELPEFINASKEIGYSPTHQANLLETAKLSQDVLEHVEEKRLPLASKV
jgi:hypothetical protein